MKKIDEKTVKKFWGKRADKYGKVSFHAVTTFSEGPEIEERDKLERQHIREELDFSKDRNIIDLGCGIGRMAIELSKDVDFILAIDYAKPLVDIGREEVKAQNIKNVEFFCDSSADFRYYKKTFDAVVICGLFNNFNDETFEKTLRNINRHLKFGGKVIAKESVGIGERFEIVDKFSEEIGAIYNSIYRMIWSLSFFFWVSFFSTMSFSGYTMSTSPREIQTEYPKFRIINLTLLIIALICLTIGIIFY